MQTQEGVLLWRYQCGLVACSPCLEKQHEAIVGENRVHRQAGKPECPAAIRHCLGKAQHTSTHASRAQRHD